MSFKVADGYVEVHARHDRASTRRNARQALDDADDEGRKREGSMLRWLFKSNPAIHKMLESPIGAIFGSPIILAAAATMAVGVAGFVGTALTTAILGGIAGGFIAGGIWVHANDKVVVDGYKSMQKKIKDSFYKASQPIVAPLLNSMKMIGDQFTKWEPSFNRIFTALAPIMEPFTGGILGFIDAMLPGIERAMPGIQTVMLALAEHLPGLGTAMGDFFATLGENGPLLAAAVGLMITWLENFFKVLGPVLIELMATFVLMADGWQALVDGLKVGAKWIEDTWNKIPGWWDATWGAVSGWFSDLGTTIGTFFSDLWTTITTWWDDQTTQVSTWWENTWGKISTWFSELPGKIGEFLASIPGIIGGVFLAAFDEVTYRIGYFMGTVVTMFFTWPETLGAILTNGWNNIVLGVNIAWNAVLNYITGAALDIAAVVGRLPGQLWGFFSKMYVDVLMWTGKTINGVGEWFDKLPGRLRDAAREAWNNVYDAFSAGGARVDRFTNDLRDRIVMALAGLGGRLYNAGRDAIMGLLNGINSLMGWAVDAAWRAARNIAQGFMDALHIGSPSKYMADKVGKWIPKGIAVGIEDNMGDLDNIAASLPGVFPGSGPDMGGTSSSSDNSTNFGSVTVEVHVDNLQELADIHAFLEGKMRNNPKVRNWAGNLYEAQGEYVRSYS